jgi:hypothetical protein
MVAVRPDYFLLFYHSFFKQKHFNYILNKGKTMKRIGIASIALILITLSLQAMEQQDSLSVTIIDLNKSTSALPQIDNAIVSLFGATPRYSLFRHYKEVVENHFKQISDLYTKELALKKDPKMLRLKGISQTVKPVILHFQRAVTLDELSPVGKRYALFLKHGLNNTLLQENMEKLFSLASSMRKFLVQQYTTLGIENPQQYLIHIMMPCYFDDCAQYIQDGSLTYRGLYTFLLSCALFYQEFYQNLNNTSQPLKVLIVIPPLRYFKHMIEQAATKTSLTPEEKEQSIVELVNAEFLDTLKGNILYTLINADVPEVISLAKRFYQQGISRERMGPVPLTLYVAGKPTPCFHPYTLKRENKYLKGGESFVIAPHLLDYFEKEYKKREESKGAQ